MTGRLYTQVGLEAGCGYILIYTKKQEECSSDMFVFWLSSNRSDDFLDEAGQPLVVGDGAVTVLIHSLEEAS